MFPVAAPQQPPQVPGFPVAAPQAAPRYPHQGYGYPAASHTAPPRPRFPDGSAGSAFRPSPASQRRQHSSWGWSIGLALIPIAGLLLIPLVIWIAVQ